MRFDFVTLLPVTKGWKQPRILTLTYHWHLSAKEKMISSLIAVL